MRIITGDLGGRVIHPPIKKWPTRPTTDRARESLFNILENRYQWDQVKGLDLFGGTGLISFEMISRGAISVHYVEKFQPAAAFVCKTAKEFKIEDQIRVFQRDVFEFIADANEPYTIIFADPPYQLFKSRELPELIFEHGLLEEQGQLIIEHDNSIQYNGSIGFEERREYGQSNLSFFSHRSPN